jgi:hypothetical protein
MADWCCAANDSMFFLPSSSVSPKAHKVLRAISRTESLLDHFAQVLSRLGRFFFGLNAILFEQIR